ncbi:hypothetical protein M91_10029, partial [Bos mutus]
MMRVPALLLVFLAPVTQVSSNTEGEKMSITKATGSGSSVEIICDLITQTLKYIHWYKYQEGTAPRRLLYYDISYSKVVLESGVSEGKYKVYKEKSYTFAILNLQESDSGMYYCAAWEKHVGLDFLYTALEILLVTAKHSRGIQYRPALASLTAPNSLYSEGREILNKVTCLLLKWADSQPDTGKHSILLLMRLSPTPNPPCSVAPWMLLLSLVTT